MNLRIKDKDYTIDLPKIKLDNIRRNADADFTKIYIFGTFPDEVEQYLITTATEKIAKLAPDAVSEIAGTRHFLFLTLEGWNFGVDLLSNDGDMTVKYISFTYIPAILTDDESEYISRKCVEYDNLAETKLRKLLNRNSMDVIVNTDEQGNRRYTIHDDLITVLHDATLAEVQNFADAECF